MMASPPTFCYLIGGTEEPVSSGGFLWESPLPTDRHHFQRADNKKGAPRAGVTHGDYFTAARRFLEENDFSRLSVAVAPDSCRNIVDIRICLMKHGEFYHPARVVVSAGGRSRSFVLNVAVSASGRRIIDAEVAALTRLGEASKSSFVPRVYGRGSVPIGGILVADMFLGEWFDGYHEFHLSRSRSGGTQALCVWGEHDRPWLLAPEATYLLYHQAAKILTSYYNPATTEHISHWHHAGGDFVVNRRGEQVDVRLITVRRYGPLLKMEKKTPAAESEQALAALLFFFLQLSIRMRLDRLDGIGDVAWADDMAAVGTWSGFLAGLSNNYFPTPLLPQPVAQFQHSLSTYSVTDLCDLADTLTPTLPVGQAEKVMIRTHIRHHMETLCDTISRVGFP